MLAEQICNGLPEPAKKYVWDKKAESADDCATEADRWYLGNRLCDTKPGTKADYHLMRRPNFESRANGGNKPSETAPSHTFNAPKPPSRPLVSKSRDVRACWSCGSNTHLSNSCPENAFKTQLCTTCGKHHSRNISLSLIHI